MSDQEHLRDGSQPTVAVPEESIGTQAPQPGDEGNGKPEHLKISETEGMHDGRIEPSPFVGNGKISNSTGEAIPPSPCFVVTEGAEGLSRRNPYGLLI